jgi:hypothetical protein
VNGQRRTLDTPFAPAVADFPERALKAASLLEAEWRLLTNRRPLRR